MTTLEILLTVAGTIIGLLLTVIGFFLARIHADFRSMEKDLPEKYVRKDDFHRAIDDLKNDFQRASGEIKEMLRNIFTRLDNKQDKE